MRHFAILLLSIPALWKVPLLAASGVSVPSKIDHSGWSALLEEYVDERGLVDYGSWEKSEADLRLLDDCQARISHRFLLNGCNWLDNKELWDSAKNSAFHRWCSAETSKRQAREAVLSLRPAWSRMPIRSRRGSRSALPRIASRICEMSGIAQFAQESESTAVGTEEAAGLINAYRRWLSRPDLNSFEHSKGRIEISAIFDWYEEDFVEEALIARKRTSHPGGDSVWIG